MWDLVTRDYSKHLNGPQVFEIVKRYVRNGYYHLPRFN